MVPRSGLEIDLAQSDRFTKTLCEMAGNTACSAVVVDLSEVSFMDCAGLGSLIQAREEARRHNKPFVIDLTQARFTAVRKIIGLTGLDTQFLMPNPPYRSAG